MDITLRPARQPEADALLGRSPPAALTGMLLDQQVPMPAEVRAFKQEAKRAATKA